MSDRFARDTITRLGELVAGFDRRLRQIELRGAGTVVVDGGETAAAADPVPRFWRDRFPTPTGTLSGATAGATLSYTPLSGSLHLYLNGLELDEGTDYDLAANEVTFTGSTPGSGDLVEARYAYTDAPADTSTPYPLVGITDDFDRADGTSLVTARSDGGTWLVPDLADATWEIQSNRLVRSDGDNIPVVADYGALDTIVINATGVQPDGFGHLEVGWGCNDTVDAVEVPAYKVEWCPFEQYMELGSAAAGIWSTAFDLPDWSDGLPHDLRITYTHSTGDCEIYFLGAVRYSDNIGTAYLAGTNLWLKSHSWVDVDPDNRNGFNYVSVVEG